MPRLNYGHREIKYTNTDIIKSYFLTYNGKEVQFDPSDYATVSATGENSLFSFRASEKFIASYLPKLTVGDLPQNLRAIQVKQHVKGNNFVTVGSEIQLYTDEDNEWMISVSIEFDSISWNRAWSVESMLGFMHQFVSNSSVIKAIEESEGGRGRYQAIVIFPLESEQELVTDAIRISRQMTFDLVKACETNLQLLLDENSLLKYFNFDFNPAFQSACESYLWSFIEFLKEMGVEATGEIRQDKEHPREVLFAVTPAKGKEALDKVSQALKLYLRVAEMPQQSPNFW